MRSGRQGSRGYGCSWVGCGHAETNLAPVFYELTSGDMDWLKAVRNDREHFLDSVWPQIGYNFDAVSRTDGIHIKRHYRLAAAGRHPLRQPERWARTGKLQFGRRRVHNPAKSDAADRLGSNRERLRHARDGLQARRRAAGRRWYLRLLSDGCGDLCPRRGYQRDRGGGRGGDKRLYRHGGDGQDTAQTSEISR